MTSARPRNPRTMSLVCLGLTVIASTAAVRAPRPQSLAPKQTPTLVIAPVTAPVLAPQITVAPAIAAAPTPIVPAVAPDRIAAPAVAPVSRATAARAGEPIPLEVLRKLIAIHYPSVLNGDPSINLITFVFVAKGNYVLSSADYQGPNQSKVGIAFRTESDSARVLELKQTVEKANAAGASMDDRRATLEAKLNNASVDEMRRAEETRYAKMKAAYGNEPTIVNLTQADSEKVLIAKLKVRRAMEANFVGDTVSIMTNVMPKSSMLTNLVNPESIESVEVRKFPEGGMGPLPVGIIVIQLKPISE